ncbi:hypothetical protein M408DRAFT_328750, partial [Serendipita vermifera MAFF 305830]
MTSVESKRVDRAKVSPFLIRVFVKQYPGHRTSQFDGPDFPSQDEFQVYTWMDSTLQELLLTLRAITSQAPGPNGTGPANSTSAELHHPSAKYTFRSVYPDPATGGRFQSKELGDVYARDLSDSSIFDQPFPPSEDPTEVEMKPDDNTVDSSEKPRGGDPDGLKPDDNDRMDIADTGAGNEDDNNPENGRDTGKHAVGREARTLADLRFRKGDYLAIAVRFPKTPATPGLPPVSTAGGPGNLNIRGSAGGPAGGGGFGARDSGPARQIPWVTSPTTPTAGTNPRDARKGPGWRGGAPAGPSRGGFGGRDGPGDRRAIPPPRDNGYGDRRGGGPRGGGRGGPPRGGRRSRSGSQSPRRRSRSRDLSMGPARSKSLSRSRSRSPPRRHLN